MDQENRLEQRMNEFYDADTHISTWADVYFNKKDGISEIDRSDLRPFFEYCGAKEPSTELRGKLDSKHFGNKSRATVMRDVWGKHYDDMIEFCNSYVAEYESKGETLPHLKDKPKSKTEGMIGFFTDLTALAFAGEGNYTFEDFDLVTSKRIESFEARKVGSWKKENFQITIKGYNKNEEGVEVPFAPASFPPDFPEKALSFIRTWSSVK